MSILRAICTFSLVCLTSSCNHAEHAAEENLVIASDEIYHMGFVVDDLDAAIARWMAELGVGPFFVAKQFVFENPDYRGKSKAPPVSLAFAYDGHIMIELIEPLDETPSPYQELIARTGYGFHHLGYLSDDVDASARQAEARGYRCIFRANFAGGRLAYCDPDGLIGTGVIEFVQRSPDVEALLDKMHEAAASWDGNDPVRPLM